MTRTHSNSGIQRQKRSIAFYVAYGTAIRWTPARCRKGSNWANTANRFKIGFRNPLPFKQVIAGPSTAKLPLLPTELDIVLLRPADTNKHPGMRRQFIQDFRVRRQGVSQWLRSLQENTVVSQESATNDGGTVSDIDTPVVSAVPNFLPDHSEIDSIRRMAGPHLT
ncbi:hypothetical protein E8E15_010132 [Penicillium rubens]|nr:hypothetical protein E8E15_010132 [Penicillium rubens]